MGPNSTFGIQSGRADRVRRRTPAGVGRRGAALMVVALFVSLLAGAGSAWASASARFVPEASSATWSGQTATVTFTETGLEPGSTTTIAATAVGTVETVCRQGPMVLISTRSSSTVTETAKFGANADGAATGTQVLNLVVNPPVITGLGCTVEMTRTFTVTLHDLQTGAVLVMSG